MHLSTRCVSLDRGPRFKTKGVGILPLVSKMECHKEKWKSNLFKEIRMMKIKNGGGVVNTLRYTEFPSALSSFTEPIP